jgi:type II secretory pathway predicted ATPase ExeA
MYEAFFGFNDRPFSPAPQAKRYYPSGAAEAAQHTLSRCIDRGEGIALLVGKAGTGKTLQCQLLAEQFRSRFAVAFLSSGQISNRQSLYQAIHYDLRLSDRVAEAGELSLALFEYLRNNQYTSGGLLLVIDDAHALSLRMVEELRLLSDAMQNRQSRVRLMVAGGPRLEERLASPKLESFNQRVAARCYLRPFNYDETLDYIRRQVLAVGGIPERVFAADAISGVQRATDGVPRLINQVCDHALLVASANGDRQVSAGIVEEAWADLQQLPAPRIVASTAKDAGERAPDIIEFGALEDVELAPENQPTEDLVIPKLRAVPEFAETRMFDGEVSDRLDSIAATLESIERADESPVPLTAPREKLRPSANDPFAEPFAVEEAVDDRLAKLESNVFANRPLVRSAEGRELSAILDRHQKGAEPDSRSAESGAKTVPMRSSDLRPADDPVLPEDPATVSILIGASLDEPSMAIGAGEGVRVDEGRPELDLIVVEDDPPDPDGPPPSGPRREGFQQLFTRLRRG